MTLDPITTEVIISRIRETTAAMAHVTVCTANIQCERFPGDLIGPVYYEQALTKAPLRYQADRLWVPEGPGLGVTM